MSDNIFDPIVDAIFQCGKAILNCFSDNKFDFKEFFIATGLKNKEGQYPKLVKSYHGDLGMTYLFNVPLGLNESDFKDIQDSLSIQLRKPIEIRVKSGFIEIETIEKELPTNIPYVLPKRSKDSICIPIGMSLDGEIWIDLREYPHSYIVGTTGSGKSVCTKGILTSLISMYKPYELELYLGDLKRVELSLFADVKHCKRFVYTVDDVTELIADLLAETNKRYDLFMEHGVTSIFEYNQLPRVKKLKYQVLYLEEIVMLLEDPKKRAMKLLKQLIAISRASGLYVFLTTQRPSNDVIDNVVKANINNRIVFKCEDSKNSIVALDKEGAEQLQGKGHGLLKQGANITEFRSYFISDTEVKKLIETYLNVKANEKARPEDLPVKPKIKNELPQTLDLSFLD